MGMKKMEYLTLPLEVKGMDDKGKGSFEGFASTFGNVDFGDDVIDKGAFTKSLADWKARNQLPLMTWQHDIKIPVGDFFSMEENEKGLFFTAAVWTGDKQTEMSKTAHNMLTGTGPKGMSIGFNSIEEKEDTVGGQRVRRLTEIKLFEIAIVPFGMNDQAVITSAKSLINGDGNIIDIRAFEKILRDEGLSVKQAKTLLSGGYSALSRDDGVEDFVTSIKNFSQSIQG